METTVQESTMSKLRPVLVVILVVAVAALAAYTYKTIKEARYSGFGPNIITVQGEGEVFAIPDIATFSFSVLAEAVDATEAQMKSAEATNAILAFLKENGVEDADVKTVGYNLNPKYDYGAPCPNFGWCPPQEPTLIGYEVSQTVEVKVRDTDKAGSLITGVGERGATNVGGLVFTIDDQDAVQAQAREMAIKDAKAKADVLADNLDVRIVRMTGYYEEMPYQPYYGYGGSYDMAKSESAVLNAAPSIPMGENKVMSRINISYEIR